MYCRWSRKQSEPIRRTRKNGRRPDADCEIPVGNVSAATTRLRMRIDTSERWGLSADPMGDLIDLYRVFLHEALHACGLGHKPASIRDPALIAPMYSPSIRHLQPADKGELLRRYGPAKVAPTPVPPPGSVPQSIQARVELDAYGGTYVAAGAAKRKPSAIYVAPHPAMEIIRPIEQPEVWNDDPTEGDLT